MSYGYLYGYYDYYYVIFYNEVKLSPHYEGGKGIGFFTSIIDT